MKTHLNPLDPRESNLTPSMQRIADLASRPVDLTDTSDTSSLAAKIRWVVQAPERIRLAVREGEREKAQRDLEMVKVMLDKWRNVKGGHEILKECKAALAFE
jgi:hypothetical protein